MSQVLVSPPTTSAPMILVMEPPTSQLHLNTVGDREVCASVEERIMVSQLAYLASQHHTSEYNRLKFGSAGAPVAYTPLSIQLPAQVQEMKAKQAQSVHKRAWWPAGLSVETRGRELDSTRRCPQECSSEPLQQENIVPGAQASITTELEVVDLPAIPGKPIPPLNYPPALNLRRELSVAMSSPLSIITIPQLSPRIIYHQPNLDLHAKTSESHPINISPIVPFELLPLISSHLVPTASHTPYMFDVPPSLLLNHVTMHASPTPSDTARSPPMIRSPEGGFLAHPDDAGPPTPTSYPPTWSTAFLGRISKSTVSMDGLASTTHSELDGNSKNLFDTFSITSEAKIQPVDVPSPLQHSSMDAIAPDYDSLTLPPSQDRPHSAPPSFISSLVPHPDTCANKVIPPPLTELVHAISSDILNNKTESECSENTNLPILCNADVSTQITWAHNLASPYQSPPTIGNMLLSSCPGKKVRLSGPVKGRGAICRDLGHDLRRVKALGVGCVICCLDDEELDFLGASWPQYSEIARNIGLDILRIPIPEGLAPATPAQLDEHLSHIIHSYTLKGVPVLVHCRGGVGRAGLVACCWMLKLGLCGWLRPPAADMNGQAHQRYGSEIAKVRKEIVQLVERVIAVVRRRRSVKAIETYEQVRFLVEFVEHLQSVSSQIP